MTAGSTEPRYVKGPHCKVLSLNYSVIRGHVHLQSGLLTFHFQQKHPDFFLAQLTHGRNSLMHFETPKWALEIFALNISA